MAKRKAADTRSGDRHTGTAKTIRFTDAQMSKLDAVKAKTGGAYSEAIETALDAFLERTNAIKVSDLSPDLVAKWVLAQK